MPSKNVAEILRLTFGTSLACVGLIAPLTHAQVASEAPKVIAFSSDHGPAQSSQQANITVHLKIHDEVALDKAVEGLYKPGSPTYHQWLTKGDLAKYGSSANEIDSVKKELEAHGLSIVSVDANSLSIRARGTIGNLQEAFQTQIHEFEKDGKTFHANVSAASLTGSSGKFVDSVSGLSSFPMKPMIKYRVDPRTGKQAKGIPLPKSSSSGILSQYFTSNCFKSPTTVTLTTEGATLPVGVYYGNIYDQGDKICGWTPQQVLNHYGLQTAVAGGLDGSGETIVIVDGPSDASIAPDFVNFSKLAGLPGPSADNFKVIYPDGKPSAYELEYVTNWDGETTLDIEWVHGIAPKAKIVLLITPTEDWSEFEYAIQYAIDHKLGNVISNSYGYPEFLWGAHTAKGFDQVLKTAAASGIAVNFASGDGGDEGSGAPNVGGASYPSTSSYATQIGGTSIGIPDGNGGREELGWGMNQILLSFEQDYVLDPPSYGSFFGGAGGGESTLIPKPSWQKNLPGTGRQGPDISAVADPFTGAIVVTGGYIGSIGGTSLATPIFSAIWALADQKAGKPLGQAAPLLASLPSTAIKDIVPFSSPTNPTGVVYDSAGSTFYSSDSLLAPLYTTTQYFSALWSYPDFGGEYIDVSFGTDSSLTTTVGWDNVTGYGVPNGFVFIKAAVAAK
jgi:subtilase family serine protease